MPELHLFVILDLFLIYENTLTIINYIIELPESHLGAT